MPEVKKHLQGEPCWAELATSDEKSALRFYSGILGWKDDPRPMGPGQVYHMQTLDGLSAAAIYQMGEVDEGAPPHWRIHIAVESADDTAGKVTAAGGKVVMGPFDVFDSGRMVVAQDPSGAIIAFWEARKNIGYSVQRQPGAVAWNELMTRDASKAIAFYKAVLGVKSAKMGMPGHDYTMLKVGDEDSAGIMQMPGEVPAMVPSHWTPYFGVANCDATVRKAQSLGATVVVQVQEVPGGGRFAILADPQGAQFGVFQPAAI